MIGTKKWNINKNILIFQLIIILLIAGYLRFSGLNWGFFHPDEGVFKKMFSFFYHGDLNPHFFYYPTFYSYLTAFITFLLIKIKIFQFSEPNDVILIGRFISAFFSTLTVYICYLIGKEIHSKEVGLISALLFTFTGISVVHAHFFTVDTPLAFFFSLFVLFFLILLKNPQNLNVRILSGIAAGITVGIKYTAIILIIPSAIIIVLNQSLKKYEKMKLLSYVFLLMALTFILTSPFILIDFQSSTKDILYQMKHVRTGHGGLFPEYSESGWIWYLTNGFPWSYGIGLSIFFYIGIIYSAILVIKKRNSGIFFILLCILSYFALIGSWEIKIERYALPIIPLGSVIASIFIIDAINKIRNIDINNIIKNLLIIIILIAAVIHPLIFSFSYLGIFTDKNVRIEAKEWIESNIPVDKEINIGPVRTPPSWMLPPLKNRFVSKTIDSKTEYVLVAMPMAKYIYLPYLRNKEKYLPEDWNGREFPTEEELAFYSTIFLQNKSEYELVAQFKKVPRFFIFRIDEESSPYHISSFSHPEIRIYRLKNS